MYCIIKYIQGDPQIVDIIVGYDFLFKEVYINMCVIISGCGSMAAWNLEQKGQDYFKGNEKKPYTNLLSCKFNV